MSEMDRAQILDSHQDIRDACESLTVCEHLDELAAHDAALRQRIAQLEARLNEMYANHPESGGCYAALPKLRKRVAELEAEIEDVRTALGCHRAYILASIRDLQAKTDDIPSIDRVHQAEMKAQQLEAEVARLNKAMDPTDQECCDLQAKWKAEAQWAAHMYIDSPVEATITENYERAKRILDGQL